VGLKNELFDRHLRLNVAAFENDFTNAQVTATVTNGTTSVQGLTNANAARIRGIDFDANALITNDLELRLAATYLDGIYTDFQNAPYYAHVSALPQNGGVCPGPLPSSAPVPAKTGGVCAPVTRSADGNQIIQAPRWHLTAGVNYHLDTESGVFNFDANLSYISTFAWTADNLLKGGDYPLLDQSVTYVPSGDDRWQIRLWGKNVTGEKYSTFGSENTGALGYVGSAGAPATFGGEVTYRFSEPSAEPAAAPAAYVPPPVQAPMAPKSYLVFFDFNKSDLTPQAVTIVDQAARNAAPAKVTQLTVTGHTDTVGSDAYNMRLSRRRAESVAAQLEKDGIPSSEIAIVAKGKRDLLVPTADGVKEPQNRRVQIVYDNGATS
jgi:outer membrane protein OmpA-like peptidoglycan-associated protein